MGMPHKNSPMTFGDLFITFNVELPKSLTNEQITALKACLPPPLNKNVQATKNTYELTKYTETRKESSNRNGHVHHDEEEEEEMHGGSKQNVQCNQQ